MKYIVEDACHNIVLDIHWRWSKNKTHHNIVENCEYWNKEMATMIAVGLNNVEVV